MALQDVCGFDTILLSQWNASFFSSLTLENPTDPRWHYGRRSSSPMEFYVPVHEYLTEDPIQFGQACLNSSRTNPTASDDYGYSLPSTSASVPLPFPLGHGTTTLGFAFQGGVIAAADSRSSCSGLVACPASQKILPIHSHLVSTTSGTSADCALWKRILSRELRIYQLRHRRRLSTGGAAKLLSHMLHPFKGTKLCVAATLCGWDGEDEGPQCEDDGDDDPATETDSTTPCPTSQPVKESDEKTKPTAIGGRLFQPGAGSDEGLSLISGQTSTPMESDLKTQARACTKTRSAKHPKLSGPRVIYVCSDGLRLKGELFSVGSGSPYAYSILDERIRWGLSVDEAVSIAREAVYRATYRDAYSGNNVDLYHVTAKGWKRRDREDLKQEYYREKERERRRVEERRKEREEKSQAS